MNKRITIFGASGNVGKYVVEALAKKNYVIKAAARNPDNCLFLKPLGDVGQITPIYANMNDEKSIVDAVENSDFILNLAGIIDAKSRKSVYDIVHVKGPEFISQVARKQNVKKLVHVSALDTSPSSVSNYMISKKMGEEKVKQHFPQAVIIQPAIIYGENDNFLNLFAKMAKVSPFIPIICEFPNFSDDKKPAFKILGAKMQPVYVRDVARAIVKAIIDDKIKKNTLKIAGDSVFYVADIARLVLKRCGYRRRFILPMPIWTAKLLAYFLEFFPYPILTRDLVEMITKDNIDDGKDWKILNMSPACLENEILSCLKRHIKYQRR